MCMYTDMNFDDPINCLTYNAQRIARSMGRQMEIALRPVGLTNQQFSTLTILKHFKVISTLELADKMGVERTTMTRNLEQMRLKGWLEPAKVDDQRVRAFRLTAAGEKLQSQALPLWKEQQANFMEYLGKDTASDLVALAGKV
ncbi:MAG: winged helix-turn-helix transcriptional regulator [Proteobacteria bacterium]|nr:winged helix-turn-helix transcriptional regulator [Pseudomonadota bacterium]